MQKQFPPRGFTLIEILLVFVLIVSISVFSVYEGIPMYRRGIENETSRQKEIQNKSEQLQKLQHIF